MDMVVQIAVTALVSALILLVEHYAPVKAPHPIVNYVLGILALVIPFSGLLAFWQLWGALAAIWSVVLTGGLAVMAAYGIDHYLALHGRVKAAELEAQLLRPEVSDAQDDNE
jgi:cobalamin biosynthesis protein CobD/CbiB